MKRSKNQAVFKFLPEMWVSEKTSSGRTVTAKINSWNYKKMENIYANFIENEIKRQIWLFAARGGDVFSFSLDEQGCFAIVEPACREGIPDIMGEISPLVFYCSSCHKTIQLRNADEVDRGTWRCSCGKNSIKQLQMIYSCECGYAQPIVKPYVEGNPNLQYWPNESPYKMFYFKGKNREKAEFYMPCPNCQNGLRPDNAESSRNYKPFTLKVINLVDKKSGDFFERGMEAQKIVISKWFEKLSQEDYEKILENVELAFSSSMRSDSQRKEAEEQVRAMIAAGIIPESVFEITVNTLLANKTNAISIDRYVNECDALFYEMKQASQANYMHWINHFAFKLMQYDTIRYAKRVITLQDAIKQQIEMEFIDSPEEVHKWNKKFGIANMQVSCDIEIVSCTYGYTRKVADPNNSQNKRAPLKLSAFAKTSDGSANLVYGAKLDTEGILFEISQKKIIEWLFVNKIITEEKLPDLEDALSVKKWFAENVHGEAITIFGEIEESEKITKHVFALLHSMSHAFIKTAGEISGLSDTSLTEIIIVETASIFIYAQTSQGISLGALSGMAESGYLHFLKKTYEDNKNCIWDPICAERDDSVCMACLMLPEVACNHFNAELGRKYLYTLKEDDSSIIGFWEM